MGDESSLHEKTGARYAVGLTCGGSCTGIDAALVRIKGSGPGLHLKLIKFAQFPHTPGLRNRLLTVRKDAREIALLNFELGENLGEAALEMIKGAREDSCEVDFVACQGHSVGYYPARGSNSVVGALQIGEPAVIAELTECPVVSDFRARDLAAGGQGRPLEAYADWVLFAREGRTVACLHLGSVVGLSVIPPNPEDAIAFDVGPGNLAIDGAMSLLTSGNQDMDAGGRAAAKGVVIDEFLDYLLDHPYFGQVPPKGTGREEFGADLYLRDALAGRRSHSLYDLMATVTTSVAYNVVRAYNRFVKPRFDVTRLIVTGGGAANKTLCHHIKSGIPDAVFRVSAEYGLPPKAFDACATAILGNETICGNPANLPQATGARYPVILGTITPA
ncbi:MAG: anhydro-N-acetylmuramic acid kinase [Candidatus Hydrogenedentes bacterium]|nr:anhydro-N-acetylmuramic acid kinase [Candidatus Hydrogenedentota bacterium]